MDDDWEPWKPMPSRNAKTSKSRHHVYSTSDARFARTGEENKQQGRPYIQDILPYDPKLSIRMSRKTGRFAKQFSRSVSRNGSSSRLHTATEQSASGYSPRAGQRLSNSLASHTRSTNSFLEPSSSRSLSPSPSSYGPQGFSFRHNSVSGRTSLPAEQPTAHRGLGPPHWGQSRGRRCHERG